MRTIRNYAFLGLLAVVVSCSPTQYRTESSSFGTNPPIQQISAGGYHSCALSAGHVYCWGKNLEGQLGLGHKNDVTGERPRSVVGLSNVKKIAVGFNNTCVLKEDSTVHCWGENGKGQLGNGTFIPSDTPVQVPGLQAVDISASAGRACAIKTDGSTVCWGANGFGQLGNGGLTDSSTPVNVQTTMNFDSINSPQSGFHTCALSAGTAHCWGWNIDEQLGLGYKNLQELVPKQVIHVTGVTQIDTGYNHTCGRLTNRTVICWGSRFMGALGNSKAQGPVLEDDPKAFTVEGLTDAVQISVGDNYGCALKAGGGVVCWGDNSWAGLGDGTLERRWTPVPVSGLSDAVEISVGTFHSCARTRINDIFCWGDNSSNQINKTLAVVGSNLVKRPMAIEPLNRESQTETATRK